MAPFNIELYEGGKISEKTFLQRIALKFPPPPAEFKNKHKLPKVKFIYNQKDKTYSKLHIRDKEGKIIATFALSHLERPKLPEEWLFGNNFGLLILLAGILSSFLMASYSRKNFIEPLFELSLASEKVQKGDFDISLETEVKHKEIQRTFESFNLMCKGLKEKEELRKSFIVNLTHDLRTPLLAQERSLNIFSRFFEKSNLKNELDLSLSLEKNNRHLLRMVNLILESYRFDSDKIKLVYKDIDFNFLVKNCFDKLKILADEKSVSLQKEISPDFTLRADETCLKRILINLISNSIENISKEGFVKISGKIENNFAEIIIEDNGCGISPNDIKHIFDRYYSGKTLERKLGSGLGLDVCKKLVELHKGFIIAESEVGKRTKFRITLPTKE